jgi:GH24 family phage-related lysozyme (muramidase)
LSKDFSRRALELIKEFESVNQPGKWPEGASGVTIGYGYDLGYSTREQFARDWSGRIPPAEIERLTAVIGLRGQSANLASKRLGDIRISQKDSIEVLERASIPDYTEDAQLAFPGFDSLPLDAQGALVSLVYNRGTRMEDRNAGLQERREMRAVRDAVSLYHVRKSDTDLREVAKQIRSMKRLWEGKGLDGLLRRREAEAQLVESCIAVKESVCR